MTSPIRVLIVDDEELVTTYLSSILKTAMNIEVVGIEHDGAAAVDAALRLQPDVLLLDLRMPGVGGLSAIERLRAHGIATAIIVLTMFDDDHSVTSAMVAGANGFVLKSTSPQDLLNIVTVSAQGQTVLSPAAADRLIADRKIAERKIAERKTPVAGRNPISSLTGRERDVLALLGEGSTNAEIGRKLQLTESTVKGYVSQVLRKLNCANRSQAGLLARGVLRGTEL